MSKSLNAEKRAISDQNGRVEFSASLYKEYISIFNELQKENDDIPA